MEAREEEQIPGGKKRRKIIGILFVLLIVICILAGGMIRYAGKDRKPSQENIGRLLENVAVNAGEDYRIAVAAEEVWQELVQQFGEERLVKTGSTHLGGEARRLGAEFLIMDGFLEEEEAYNTGYTLLGQDGSYTLYGSSLKPGEWKITQCGTVSGLQSMAYSLVSEDGKLILLDGGHPEDADACSRLAELFGNRVDLWICSHFHDDHIGAVIRILEENPRVEVGEIWCPPMDAESYRSFAKEWDCVESCESFLKLIENRENVYRIRGGDDREFAGLKFHFLSSYDPEMAWTHEGNNCGFIFRIMGNSETMLFCCDIGNDWISEVLMKWQSDYLKADYVQMGHHGNGGLSEAAYRKTAPKAAFFDAPGWLFEDEEKYLAQKNRKLMESMGCTIYLLDDAPNCIILK